MPIGAEGDGGDQSMIYEKATTKDISVLTDLRLAYLQEDLGVITVDDLQKLQASLPGYYEKHLNKDLMVYIAREEDTIVSCAFLLIVEKPMSPAFITGKTGTVLNVYTKEEHRRKGHAKKLMAKMLEDANAQEVSVIELKATEEGYPLYKSIGFVEVGTQYCNMRITLK